MTQKPRKKISIIGFGRFGQTLHRLLKDDFKIVIFDINSEKTARYKDLESTFAATSLEEAWSSDTVFLSVPMSSFEKVLKSSQPYIDDQLIIDVLSVKSYPKKLYGKYLKDKDARSLLAHPMFGPDSSKDGFQNLPIVLDLNTAAAKEYQQWKKYFEAKGLKAIEMTAEEHDKIAAKSQAMTHIIGRVLGDFGYARSEINTMGDRKMIEIIEQTCHDDIDLFYNMQNKNSYTRASRKQLQRSVDKVFKSIVNASFNHKRVPRYGIQGGEGSFNDVAIHKYLSENNITKYEIVYLHTTKRVLDALDIKEIDYGLFAVSNSRGGIVEETTEELGKHKFEVISIINIPIVHYVLGEKNGSVGDIKKLMAHPQVFKQCAFNLSKKYPDVILESGKGKAIDNAKIAELLSKNKLAVGTAVMGSSRLAEIYGLEILDSNLQDDPHNTTNFLLVK